MVQRYNNWQGRAAVLRYVDIWTEWPNTTFYDGDLSQFPVFWTKAYSALKAAYPNLKIGGPGLLSGSANQPSRDFLTYLYQNGAKPDWIGFHVFSSSAHDAYDEAVAYRQLLQGTGSFSSVAWAGTGFFTGVELIMDAYYSGSKIRDANGKSRSMTAQELDQFHNKGKGAAWLASFWIGMQYAGVQRSYFYRGNDDNSVPGADPSSPNVGGPGLFYADGAGTFKPVANAFRFFSRLYRGFPVLLSTANLPSSAGSTELWTLGAQSADGRNKAVLLANFNDAPVEAAVQFEGTAATASQFARVDVYQVSDSLDGQTATSWTGDVLSVPANTVEWIVFRADAAAPPSASVLLAPWLDLITTTTAPTLAWSKPENSTTYRVQVAADNAFSSTAGGSDDIGV